MHERVNVAIGASSPVVKSRIFQVAVQFSLSVIYKQP